MTEQEYINVRDLSNVKHALEILMQVCPANQPGIPSVEYEKVMGTLQFWQERLFEVVDKNQSQNSDTHPTN